MKTAKAVKKKLLIGILSGLVLMAPGISSAEIQTAPPPEKLPPSAIGWGNLFVPGLGATLRDQPWTGLTEAGLEIGSFYGSTLLGREGRFKIDGSIEMPTSGSVRKPVVALIFQEFGLKYHFYNTFYHYQQAVLDSADSERERSNPQPIYKGDWKDMLAAPFKWENLSSPWTWPVMLGGAAFLIYDYAHTPVVQTGIHLGPVSESLLAFSQSVAMPIGSSFGEDVLFRGFMQREILGTTGSLPLAIVTQSALFAFLHDNRFIAFGVGSYFGVETYALKGELGPVIAAHFWLDVVDGFLTYLRIRRSEGIYAPLLPPIVTQMQFHF